MSVLERRRRLLAFLLGLVVTVISSNISPSKRLCASTKGPSRNKRAIWAMRIW